MPSLTGRESVKKKFFFVIFYLKILYTSPFWISFDNTSHVCVCITSMS